jgi:Alpha/beta hydrolase family
MPTTPGPGARRAPPAVEQGGGLMLDMAAPGGKGWTVMTVNPGSSPPVVFIAQLGTGGASWQPVIDLLTCGATTVTYDRPGTGNAPPRPAPNPPLPYSAFSDELEALLAEHGISEHPILVGHSFGSLIARMFTGRNVRGTAGVVHVDGSIPRGVLWPPVDWPPPPDGDGPDATAIDRMRGEVEILESYVPRIPAVVITRSPGRLYPGYPPEVEIVWTGYQRQLARQLSAPLIVAADAGHQIPREEPRLVAHVVDAIVQAVRTGERWTPDPPTLAACGGALDPEVPDPRRTRRLR